MYLGDRKFLRAPPKNAGGAGGRSKAQAKPKAKASGGQPSIVAQCFARYSVGIKAKTGVDYPSSARAKGQLAQLVKRLGAEAAPP